MEEKQEILRGECGEGGDLIRTQGEDGEEGGDCEGGGGEGPIMFISTFWERRRSEYKKVEKEEGDEN